MLGEATNWSIIERVKKRFSTGSNIGETFLWIIHFPAEKTLVALPILTWARVGLTGELLEPPRPHSPQHSLDIYTRQDCP